MLTYLQEAKDQYLSATSGGLSPKQDAPDSYQVVTNYHQGQQTFQKKTMSYATIL